MNNRYLSTAILLFITLALGMFLLLPKYKSFGDSQTKIKKLETEIKQWQDYYSKIEKNSQELQKYADVLSKIDSAIPSELSIPSLFSFMQKISLQSGLVLRDIGAVSTSVINPKTNLKSHFFNVSLSGSYSSLKNFLSILEKSARFLEVESISFSSPAGTNEIFNFSLNIKTHSY